MCPGIVYNQYTISITVLVVKKKKKEKKRRKKKKKKKEEERKCSLDTDFVFRRISLTEDFFLNKQHCICSQCPPFSPPKSLT